MRKTNWTTDLVSQKLNDEQCKLVGVYVDSKTKIQYEFEGNTFTVRWSDWLHKNSRPHLHGGNRDTQERTKWTQESVNELFKKDNCELSCEYKNSKQRLIYKYKDSLYGVTLDDWIHKKSRPHLNESKSETRFRKYLEEHKIEFETQKTFEDLKSNKQDRRPYKLRFDFFLPTLKLLIEIDDVSHKYNKEQIERGKIKDQYCEEHKLRLLRIDAQCSIEEYDTIIKYWTNPPEEITKIKDGYVGLFVFKYGKMYSAL